MLVAEPVGGFQREAGLPDAARSDDGGQPAGGEQRGDAGKVVVAADEAGQRPGQVRRPGARGRGRTGSERPSLAEALCARLPGHVMVDEPYHLLEEQGYEFGLPPSADRAPTVQLSVNSSHNVS
ncbi:hypothetical protein [Micromonospora carbonacea]|uniref:hypothetical protein n=1 Tax=Micromonospora carbonacea TaxID=47853 RepID=UPI0009440312|nr:hypothetical protein [Micromonospora carbonacea]